MPPTGGPRRSTAPIGPPAPRRRPVRRAAGPAGPIRVIGPPRPQRRSVGSLGPAGQPRPVQGPARPLSKQQLAARYTHRGPARRVIAPAHPPLLTRVAGALADVIHHARPIGTTTVGSRHGHGLPGAVAQPGLAGSPARSIPALALKNIAVATAQHPGQVTGNTAKGFGEIIAGTPAGIAGLVMHPTTIGQLPSAIGRDFSRRYGPLVQGNEKAFRDRIRKEGAAPEILDFNIVGGAATSAAGRALGGAARAGDLGEGLKAISTVRPALRVSGGLAREQEVSPNLFRAVAQRGEDVVRQKALVRRSRVQPRGVQPRLIEGPVTRTGQAARGAGEVVPLFQARAQRVAVSRRAARSYLANRREQAVELSKGVERDLAGLNAKQREGVFHVTSGIVPVARREGEADAAYFARVNRALEDRKQQILGHHAANPDEPKPAHPKAELHTIERLQENIPEVFGDGKLAAFHARNLERSRRLAALDPGVENTDAFRHPYRVQGEAMGLHYKPPEGLKGKELKAFDEEYVREVKAEASARGLQDPAYFRHQEFPTSGFGARTAANLRRGVAASNKQSELKLFRRGQVITDPDVLVQGLAGNIKRRHQWNAVADTVEAHALPWSRKPNGQGRSVYKLQREIQERGLNPDDYEFVDFRRFRKAIGKVDEGVDSENKVRELFDDVVKKPGALAGRSKEELKALQGFVAVPKGVGEELNAALRPSGKPLRVLGRVQGFQSGAILGLNPSWLQMQVAANTLQYGLGARGNFKDLLASQKWYRDLPEDLKQRVDEYSSVGVGMGHATQPQLGSHAGSVAQMSRRIGQIPLVRSKRGTIRVTDLNPTHPLFAIDEAQNRAFRRAAFYNEAKRQAFKNMKRELSAGAVQAKQVEQLLRLKPGEDLEQQVRRVLENPQQIEKLGEHVDRVLGDYLRYTSKERTYLKPTIMFYGFMRYALKTLFYTLPIKHPLAGAVAGKLGQLHDDELRRMFGTKDIPPWILSRVYSVDSKGNPKRDSKGQLQAIDLARINPVSSPLVESADRGPSAFAGLASPIVQALQDQVYTKSAFKNRGFRVHGSAEENPNPDLTTRGRIVANQLGQALFPYREAQRLTQTGTQGDDTLLFSPRPIHYKTAGPQAQEAERQRLRPSALQTLASDLVPLGFPKRDASTENFTGTRAGSQAPVRPRTAADRERLLLIREARQAQQETQVSDRERRLLIKEALAARGG